MGTEWNIKSSTRKLLENKRLEIENKTLNKENELFEIKHQLDLAGFRTGNILINDQDFFKK